MQRKKLPIGIQSFAKIRQDAAYYYVDKTPFALRLIDQGSYYFLSRPRRFGKSLFVDTLKELFEGNQALFEGLFADANWDWSVQYPVIRLSFGGGVLKSPERLDISILNQLTAHEQRFGLTPAHTDAVFRFQHLIRNLHQATGQRVVVLVDEYDKPILDNLQQAEVALEMRDGLRNLYSALKDSDAHLKFVFLTGVSKFSKVNLFSGLNNLEDITLSPTYSALCGYTDADLDTVFAPELPGLDRSQIQTWYNGYNWRGDAVYNPFDLLLLFREREFRAYWFETGTPTFLVDFLARNHYFTPNLARLETDESLISSFDIEQMSPEALLWQTGYLTFQSIEELTPGNRVYTLSYPNREVESALNKSLLPAYGAPAQSAFSERLQWLRALQTGNTEPLKQSLKALFASMPHASAVDESASLTAEDSRADWYRNNSLAQYEGYYASVFYSQLAALGLDTRVEDATNKGRIDLALRYQNRVYLFEFKVIAGSDLPVPSVQPEASETDSLAAPTVYSPALQQLLAKGYADKYRAPGVSMTLIGITFSKQVRNVVKWETLTIS